MKEKIGDLIDQIDLFKKQELIFSA